MADKLQSDLLDFENGFKGITEKEYKRKANLREKRIVSTPYPFIKWAGGKRELIPQISEYIPTKFNKYIEPFLGGGSIFFFLLPKKSILIDINKELMNCYWVLQQDVHSLIKELEKLKRIYLSKDQNEREKLYYQIRDWDKEENFEKKYSTIERATRTIFLNKTCFNGLYRVNQSGYFNTPFGFYEKPSIYEEQNLLDINKVLKDVMILNSSFKECLKYAEKDDFIYIDSPYYPISKTALFTNYTKEKFDEKSHKEVYKLFKDLNEKGCNVLESNSYCEFILNLYKEFKIIPINASRRINNDATKRGKIKEVLIMNA